MRRFPNPILAVLRAPLFIFIHIGVLVWILLYKPKRADIKREYLNLIKMKRLSIVALLALSLAACTKQAPDAPHKHPDAKDPIRKGLPQVKDGTMLNDTTKRG